MDTENNQIKIHEYISNINKANIYGGDIEISLAYEILQIWETYYYL